MLCLLRGLYVSAVSSGILQPMRPGTCACPADAALGAHEHDFHVQQLGQRWRQAVRTAPSGRIGESGGNGGQGAHRSSGIEVEAVRIRFSSKGRS